MSKSGKDISLKITADSKDAEKGINNVTAKLNKLSKTIQKNPITKLSKSIAAIGIAGKTASVALSAMKGAIDDCTEAYKKQAKAEINLQNAVKNSPYLDGSAVKALSDYASSLQATTAIGDEELIPFMAQLANAGRNQSEIMDIMSAATDVAATGMMSLDSAVSSLNGTFNGTTGQLGKQISAIKALTTEELKAGKAVEIIKTQFEGNAKAVADQIGGAQKLANAWGDYKETLGSTMNRQLNPIQSFFAKIVQGWADSAKAYNDYRDAISKRNNGDVSSSNTDIIITNEEKRLKAMEENFRKYSNDDWRKKAASNTRGYLSEDFYVEQAKKLEVEIEAQKKHIESLKKESEATKKVEEAKKAENLQEEEKATRNRDALKLINDNTLAMSSQIEKIRASANARKQLGETVDDNATELEVLKVMEQSYIDLVSKDTKLVTANNSVAKERLSLIKEQANFIKDENKDWKDLEDTVNSFANASSDNLVDTLQAQLEAMEALRDSGTLTAEQFEKISIAISNCKEELENAKWDATVHGIESVMTTVSTYVDKVAQIANSITSLLTTNLETQTSLEETKLETMYEKGLISYESYSLKKQQIEEENAQKSYEIEMWAWGVQLLQAQASTALSMVQTLADTSITNTAAKVAMMSLMGALGAAQTAAIIAAKPQAPNFSNGGIVGGSSYTGDNVRANVNSREMILNDQQQWELWKLANGNSSGKGNEGINLDVEVNNNASDIASATVNVSEGKLIATINKIVNSEMRRGTYTDSMLDANSKVNGVRYL